MAKSFSLQVFSEIKSAPTAFLMEQIPAARKLVQCTLQDMSIICIGDRRMRQLHQQFMNLNTTTDVLTFPLEFDKTLNVTAGEIYVCVPEATRQARARTIPVAYEVLLYAIHGMLHLCGFDDRTKTEFRKMHIMEDQILTTLGFGKVFAVKSVGARA